MCVNFAVIVDVRDENGFTPDEAAELMRRIKEVKAGVLERHDLIEIEEVEPDDFDLELIAEAERENDGAGKSLEQLAEELGVKL
ncbi:MAG: hypothetical protein IJG62_00955 [Synergistaceae bacterium]|nr:hypothetical protein [Synergistaceae bacterium]